MTRSAFSPDYREVTNMLVALRKRAGLTQRELAAKLNRELSFISRIEKGQRRVDLLEFAWLCRACGFDAKEEAVKIFEKIEKAPIPSRRPSRRRQ